MVNDLEDFLLYFPPLPCGHSPLAHMEEIEVGANQWDEWITINGCGYRVKLKVDYDIRKRPEG